MVVAAKARCWHGFFEWNDFINTCGCRDRIWVSVIDQGRVDLVTDKKDIFCVVKRNLVDIDGFTSIWGVAFNLEDFCNIFGDFEVGELSVVRALYRFHTYYHVMRILSRIRAPTPSQEDFDKYKNAFFLEVRRVGNEYGCSTENLGIYRNQYYFDKSGRGSHVSYAHNNWSQWIMN